MLLFVILCVQAQEADTSIIRGHLQSIIETEKPRNHLNVDVLDQVAEYIYQEFSKYADTSYYQTYIVDGKKYKNVICVFGSQNDQTIVVGAHYDVCEEQDGADDNASGVVGLLELARLLKSKELSHRIEIVAYTLEEPPHFRTENMGSYVHAKSMIENDVTIYGMVCLEMIGYFDTNRGSQEYPVRPLALIYGKKGDYITLVRKFRKGKFTRKFSGEYKRTKRIKTKKFTGPANLPGVDFSDHLNYWKYGISAVMITDTAFYRNKNYHQMTDTIETLDLNRMSKVINALAESINSIQ